MVEFIGYVSDVLAIEFTLGSTTLSLGSVALGVLLIVQVGLKFFQWISDGRE